MIARKSTAHSEGTVAPSGPPFKHMVWITGGTFLMGSNDFYPEERPVHRVAVDGFWMDEHPVTNAEFRRFVDAAGYRTVAERPPNPSDFPGADPTLLMPGSLVTTLFLPLTLVATLVGANVSIVDGNILGARHSLWFLALCLRLGLFGWGFFHAVFRRRRLG